MRTPAPLPLCFCSLPTDAPRTAALGRPAEQAESFAFMRSLCGELEDDVLPAGLCDIAAFRDF